LGIRFKLNPNMSHVTPRNRVLMPTSSPMMVRPDTGSCRQIMMASTMSIAPAADHKVVGVVDDPSTKSPLVVQRLPPQHEPPHVQIRK
jgi:hypothetical protein